MVNWGYKSISMTSKDSGYIRAIGSQVVPVTFGVFINLLDACTFGVCFFPTQLGSTSSLAIELFLLSTALVQISLIVMSSFKAAMGTSMAENIPFIHTIALGVISSMSSTHTPQEMLPTVLAAMCISTILNGFIFYMFGYMKLGYILHFFPRHIILGMTGGFGVFLIQTAFEVCTGISTSENSLFGCGCLRAVELSKIGGEMAVPLLMFALPLCFYLTLAATEVSLDTMRECGWLFPKPPPTHWWDTWEPFLAAPVHWPALLEQGATIISLAFFTLILVPIRIPSLALITGMGNILAGLVGSPHNYLSYANSILFYKSGGQGKGSQIAVTVSTVLLFLIGPTVLNFVPRILAGVIMLHLGSDLIHAAVFASRTSLDTLEYTSVLAVMAVVSVMGFVSGIAAGVMAACVTFVVQASQESNIRGVFTGDAVRSNTSWPARYRAKLEAAMASSRIIVIQLQGHLFFGNIQHVMKGISKIVVEEIAKSDERHFTDKSFHQSHATTLISDRQRL
eukprot:gene6306-12761_t